MKLTDPGKDKATKEERKTERLKVWKRPTSKSQRDKDKEGRLADWRSR
jgi:hypothetical protein